MLPASKSLCPAPYIRTGTLIVSLAATEGMQELQSLRLMNFFSEFPKIQQWKKSIWRLPVFCLLLFLFLNFFTHHSTCTEHYTCTAFLRDEVLTNGIDYLGILYLSAKCNSGVGVNTASTSLVIYQFSYGPAKPTRQQYILTTAGQRKGFYTSSCQTNQYYQPNC